MQHKTEQSNIDSYIKEKFKTSDRYEIEHLKQDWDQKENSARGVLADFIKRAGDVDGKRVLDIGFGNGVMLGIFARAGAIVSGVEVDKILFNIAQQNLIKLGVSASLSIYDGKNLPYPNNFFDYVYSTSVLEHVDDPSTFLFEACRVLKSGGKMYLAFPNRFAIRDSHSGVYLLGYFPRFLAQYILKFLGKGSLENWNLHFLSYFSLSSILKRNDINFEIIMETESNSILRRIFKKILAFLNIHHSAILSHIIIVLEKKICF